MEILKTPIQEFTHIIHLADIHIFLTKRHDEYDEVFQRLYKSIDDSPKTSVICVLGDVVHSKNDLSPECVKTASEFLFNLAERRPTVLIPGNHDANLANKNRLDSLTPIVNSLRHPNLHFLKKSGLYGMGNICFNNYSCFESEDKYIKGSEIPHVYRQRYTYFIAMYHGTVDNAISDTGIRLTNRTITCESFDKHDIALLGDIHLMQDLQKYDYKSDKPAIHYPGTLIQQNHGESLEGHGYSLWDLKTKTYEHIEIENDYGFVTVVVDKGNPLNLKNLPKKTRLRFQTHDTTETQLKSILSQLKMSTDILDGIVYEKLKDETTNSKRLDGISLDSVNNVDYQNKILTEFLKTKLKVTDDKLIAKVIELNNQTNLQINKDDFAKNIRWKPIRFEWDNMFSFGEGNVIDFTKMKSITGLFAPNTHGKSTIFSALCICLFDKCDREYKASNVLNSRKTWFRCKFEFEIDGVRYFIEKKGTADKKRNVKVDVKFWKVVNGVEEDLKGEERSDTNSIIRDYIGTYDDFILTTLSIQTGKNNASIIDMGDSARKDLFAQFMGLFIYDSLHTVADKKLSSLSSVLKNYRNTDYNKQIKEYEDALAQSELAFSSESKKLDELKENKDSLQEKIVEETKNLIKIEDNIPPLETSLANKEKFEKMIPQIKEGIKKFQDELQTVKNKLDEYESKIKVYTDKNIEELYSKWNAILNEKIEISGKIDKKKSEISFKIEKVNREKNHQYDPNCKFCVSTSASIIKDAEKAKAELEKDNSELVLLQEKYDSIHKSVEENKNIETEYEDYRRLLTGVREFKNSELTLTNKLNQANTLLTQTESSLTKSISDIELYNKNKETISKNEEVNKKISQLKLEMSNVDVLINKKNRSIMDLNGKISVFKTKIESIQTEVEKIKAIEEEHKVYDLYVSSVHRNGIPLSLIMSVIPEVEKEVNTILSQIAPFSARFETDGKNVIPYVVYNEDDNRKWLATLCSGFERFVLSVAMRIALINISNLPRSTFMVMDEGFGVLDAGNIPQMNLLFSYMKSNFDFVIIISHLEVLRDMVENHIDIGRDNGFSIVNYT